MSNPQFRFEVLHLERKTMEGPPFFLTTPQIDALVSLSPKRITDLLVKEAKDFGADLQKAFDIVKDKKPCNPLFTATSTQRSETIRSASSYDEGQIHVHCVDPPSVPKGDEIWLRAHGLDHNPRFELRRYKNDNPDETDPDKDILAAHSATVVTAPAVDDDLFQRVKIATDEQSAPGTWFIFVSNDNTPFSEATGVPFKSVILT